MTTLNSWCMLLVLVLQSQKMGLLEGDRYEAGLCFISRSVSSTLIAVSSWLLMIMSQEKITAVVSKSPFKTG